MFFLINYVIFLFFLLSMFESYQMFFYNCCLITVFVLPDTYDTDGYNPEAPSITNTSRPMYRHRVHAQRPNLIGLTSGDMDLPPRGIMINLFLFHSINNGTAGWGVAL